MCVSPASLAEKEAFLRLLPTMMVQTPRCTSIQEVKINVMITEVSSSSDEDDKEECSKADIASARLWTKIHVNSIPLKPPLFSFFLYPVRSLL